MPNKRKSSFIQQLTPYVKGFRLPLLIAVVGAIVASTITVIGPDRLKEITDVITDGLALIAQGNTKGIDTTKVGQIASQLMILYALGWLVNYLQGFIMASLIQEFSKRLRLAIAEKINRLPLAYFDSHPQGDTMSRVTNDVDTTSQSLSQSLGQLLSSLVLLIAVIIMMVKTDVKMTLTALGAVLVGYLLTGFIMAKSQPLFKRQQENLAKMTSFVEEVYSGHQVVTSYHAVPEVTQSFDQLNAKLYQSMWKSQFFSGIMMPLMQFIGNFSYVMVCVVGASLVINGEITIGTIVAFMSYVRIFSQPLSQIAQASGQLQSAKASLGRILEFLAETEMEDETAKQAELNQVRGDLSFDHVSFGYAPDKTIIHDFTVDVTAGQKIAIVGPTGAGKTTIVNLLMKFYQINQGAIKIDGIDINDLRREAVHSVFSMVLQDTWLFEGTIKENLIYNQRGISDDEVIAAAKAVGIHHFIMTLPEGYQTVLDESVSLSVGQKQLMTIARALLKNAPLLILDEATSSVDTRTEELIQRAMDKLMEGRTSFVIAHRLSTIKNADLILVMKDGNIIEQGNHDQLMTQSGFYADLYNSQFEEVTD
ncbi:ABC transporter ATP-binding protein [Streptococcus cuniculipharyngis]|uniref:ABC transporter ATP-binding protein n=1 Tax=Streptococcus cuniculipharyngis TaxID=1562651 RepID=A0A5C5SBZ4_9STRE|nr:ABC transporter ATP-binding protein [Streptococcus cuniculipharyngis]TWS96944.1 ABC transporter ATP-binding protein [Streptococcus cuniculipharyngis]